VVKPSVVIISPALAAANNGNWQTASRWQRMLQSRFDVRTVSAWPGPVPDDAFKPVAMLALHARRSADSIAAWADSQLGSRDKLGTVPGLAVVLTGTDLYRDIQTDGSAQRSLALARQLVVLQERAPLAVPDVYRAKTQVIFQSCSAWKTLDKSASVASDGPFRVVMVGHLRDEKSPQTLFAAARLLSPADGIVIEHIGDPLDAALADEARATSQACPHYRYLGGLSHTATRRRIQRAHLLVHASRMEGGAHVLMEAVRAGTPVLASCVDGNVGMMGAGYAGYFDWNEAGQLVDLLRRSRADWVSDGAGPYGDLMAQCTARAPLFGPTSERRALVTLVAALLADRAL
jgi:putative glycosyltransferase (TIGR04348 family)